MERISANNSEEPLHHLYGLSEAFDERGKRQTTEQSESCMLSRLCDLWSKLAMHLHKFT